MDAGLPSTSLTTFLWFSPLFYTVHSPPPHLPSLWIIWHAHTSLRPLVQMPLVDSKGRSVMAAAADSGQVETMRYLAFTQVRRSVFNAFCMFVFLVFLVFFLYLLISFWLLTIASINCLVFLGAIPTLRPRRCNTTTCPRGHSIFLHHAVCLFFPFIRVVIRGSSPRSSPRVMLFFRALLLLSPSSVIQHAVV